MRERLGALCMLEELKSWKSWKIWKSWKSWESWEVEKLGKVGNSGTVRTSRAFPTVHFSTFSDVQIFQLFQLFKLFQLLNFQLFQRAVLYVSLKKKGPERAPSSFIKASYSSKRPIDTCPACIAGVSNIHGMRSSVHKANACATLRYVPARFLSVWCYCHRPVAFGSGYPSHRHRRRTGQVMQFRECWTLRAGKRRNVFRCCDVT